MNSKRSVTKYVRFRSEETVAYGICDGKSISELRGSIFTDATPTGRQFSFDEVQLLVPCEPSKVLAVGLNYSSHREHVEKSEGILLNVTGKPPSAEYPVVFAKFPTSLCPHGQEIVLPADATNVHFEGEMVVVIGKKAKNVTVDEAASYVFGVTIGNDLVERNWLLQDLQWFRAKGADGFGPIGPMIVSGLNYGNLKLTTTVNGELRQSSNTSDLVFSPDRLLSYCSRYVTLMPGDVIFTGTPGKTQSIRPGDTIEVAIEGIGVLRNRIAVA